ncbi:MerR family transcriptional regulator [Sediminibacillus albus]|uniref:MerR family transcriptional regulator, glutamine synthetase repressor n=1 Tax=Sediminibacillus albus TaxID=407036 RepID=A0A1G8WWM0_9BACI|nr:MerR family transcriptional regulator [Sediminibacillus albus]SDJ82758.1 MerR family transcriptional regulator, glutamine synthetase repressor [Sediminibacillus albus]
MNHDIPGDTATFPISVVKDLTRLSARQIRYYEKQGLIEPVRNEGNRRVYSLNDINRLKEIKELIDKGINIAGIKAMLED